MKVFSALLFLTFTLSVLNPARADADLKNAFNAVTRDYFEIQKALAANNTSLAMEKSQGFMWDLKSIPVQDMNNSQHSLWFGYFDKLMRDCRGISQSTALSDQKKYLSALSKDYFDVLKTFSANSVTIYKLFCAKDGNYWLGKSATTKNPYGKSCNTVQETLKVVYTKKHASS